MMGDLILSIGHALDGRLVAVITTGGHPQINPEEKTLVLAVEVISSEEEGKKWFKRMQIERPWEERQ